MWNAGLDKSQAGIKIARKNSNSLRYADTTILMAESEEELKSLLMKVKEESENAGLKLDMQNSRSHYCSVTRSYLTLCDPTDCSSPDLPVLHLPVFAQTHVHWVSDAIQPSHPPSSPSPPAFNLSQHLGLFQWVGSLHQVA